VIIRMMVLDGNGIGDEFRWRSDTGLTRLAGGPDRHDGLVDMVCLSLVEF